MELKNTNEDFLDIDEEYDSDGCDSFVLEEMKNFNPRFDEDEKKAEKCLDNLVEKDKFNYSDKSLTLGAISGNDASNLSNHSFDNNFDTDNNTLVRGCVSQLSLIKDPDRAEENKLSLSDGDIRIDKNTLLPMLASTRRSSIISRESLGIKPYEAKRNVTSPNFSYYQKSFSSNGRNLSESSLLSSSEIQELKLKKLSNQSNQFIAKVPTQENLLPIEPPLQILNLSLKDRHKVFDDNNGNKDESVCKTKMSSLIDNPPFFPVDYYNCVEEKKLEEVIKTRECITDESYLYLRGKLGKLLKKVHYCKILQKGLTNTSMQILMKILHELGPIFGTLMNDQYGNYFFPRLYEKLNLQGQGIFLNYLRLTNIVEIARNSHGSYCLQKIIETTYQSQCGKIIADIFKDYFLELSIDKLGVRILEKVISGFGETVAFAYYGLVIENFVWLAKCKTGLGLVKKIITEAQNPVTKKMIEQTIFINAKLLIDDDFGNYAVQSALETFGSDFAFNIYNVLITNLEHYSNHQSSSRVVEICVSIGGEWLVNHFISYICNKGIVLNLMIGSYGNYVLQTMIKLSKGSMKSVLLNCIYCQVDNIAEKNIRMKWKSILATKSRE